MKYLLNYKWTFNRVTQQEQSFLRELFPLLTGAKATCFRTGKFLGHLYLPVTEKKHRSGQSALWPQGICKTKLAMACSVLILEKQLHWTLNHPQDDERCALPAFDKYLFTKNLSQVGTQALGCSPPWTCLSLCCSAFIWQLLTPLLFQEGYKEQWPQQEKPRQPQTKTHTSLALGDLF